MTIRKQLIVACLSAGLAGTGALAQSSSGADQTRSQQNQQTQQTQQNQQNQSQQDQQSQQQGQSLKQEARQDARQRQSPGIISGKIQETRKVNFNGVDQQHVLAKLQTRNGKQCVVDLGPVDKLKDLDLKKGKQLTISAQTGRINGKPILVADRIRDDANQDEAVATLTIIRVVPLASANRQGQQYGQNQRYGESNQRYGQNQRSGQDQQQFTGGNQDWEQQGWQQDNRQQDSRQGQQFSDRNRDWQNDQPQNRDRQQRMQQQGDQQRQQTQLVSGIVQKKRDVERNGQTHVQVVIESPDGQQHQIDLGAKDTLPEMKLFKGDGIAAIGNYRQVNGQRVFMAKQVADIVHIDRQSDSQSQSGDQSESASVGED